MRSFEDGKEALLDISSGAAKVCSFADLHTVSAEESDESMR